MKSSAGRWSWWLAVVWLAGLAALALSAPVLPLPYAPDSPDLMATSAAPLSGRHWLGTDPLGRDVLANLLFGAQTTCLVTLPAAVGAALLGTLLGSAAGYFGNTRLLVARGTLLVLLGGLGLLVLFTSSYLWLPTAFAGLALLVAFHWPTPASTATKYAWALPVDALVLRLIALLTAVPRLVLVLAVASFQTTSAATLLLVLTFTYWPVMAQLVRAEMQRLRQLPYLEAARVIGLSDRQILVRYALPALWRTIRTTFPLHVVTLLSLETTLSFLGVGLPPQTASWGRTLATIRQDTAAWWLVVFPGGIILLTILALYRLGKQAPKTE